MKNARRNENGRFLKGNRYSPETQFQSGQRISPSTEFKAGQVAYNKLPLGSVSVRRETHTGLFRAWVKVAEPNVWKKRAVVVWEAQNGPLPKGKVVHHGDRNSLNDAIENLSALTKADHALEHADEMQAARQMTANFAHEREIVRAA